MPEFIPILIISFMLLGVMLFMAGPGSTGLSVGDANTYYSNTGSSEPAGTEIELIAEEKNEIITLNEKEFTTSAYARGLADIKGEAKNGFFENEFVLKEFDANRSFDRVVLELNIRETNSYGGMIFDLNGNRIYSGKLELGKHIIEIYPQLLKEKNRIEVKAESSGVKIWASNVYVFDAKLTGIDGKPFVKVFNSKDEKEALVFYTKAARGELIVKLNGKEVFNGKPAERNYALLEKGLVEEKYNKIEFLPMPGARVILGKIEIQ